MEKSHIVLNSARFIVFYAELTLIQFIRVENPSRTLRVRVNSCNARINAFVFFSHCVLSLSCVEKYRKCQYANINKDGWHGMEISIGT